jgi:hypothetical protein
MRHGQSVVSVNPRPFRPFRQSVSVDEVRLLIGDYATWEVITNTPESVLQALDIELRYKTSFWDALILQAAESSGASILYSEDLAMGQRYRAVRVINPLIRPIGTQEREIFRQGSYLSKELRRLTGGMGRVVCAAAERALKLKSDLNQQGFLFESSIVTVNHFDYTANGGGFRTTQLRERSLAVGFCQ